MRVRAFLQDDAHIFCREEQIQSEGVRFCDLLREIYRDFGYEEISVKFSGRPPVRAGSDEVWDRAEAALKDACEAAGLTHTMNHGEGAFHGHKLAFVLSDVLDREAQYVTLEVDFVVHAPSHGPTTTPDAHGSG